MYIDQWSVMHDGNDEEKWNEIGALIIRSMHHYFFRFLGLGTSQQLYHHNFAAVS